MEPEQKPSQSHTKELFLQDNGDYTFEVECTDDLGRTNSIEVSFTIGTAPPSQDTTAPTMKFVDDRSDFTDPQKTCNTNKLRVKWLGEDIQSGISKYSYSLIKIIDQQTDEVIIGPRESTWSSDPANNDEWMWIENLNLQDNIKYFFDVTATNGVNLPSQPEQSDGITYDSSQCQPDSTGVSPATNIPPTANAGQDIAIETGVPVTILGSVDDSETADSDLEISWEITNPSDGGNTILTGTDTPTPTFTANVDGTYEILLTVSDGTDTNQDEVTIIAGTHIGNHKPVALVSSDGTEDVGATVRLYGDWTDEDPDDFVNQYIWGVERPETSNEGLSSPSILNPTFLLDVEGDYKFSLVVFDGKVQSDPAELIITASTPDHNRAPTAIPGQDRNIPVGVEASLFGGGSDPDPDDNPIDIFSWSIDSEPPGSQITLSDSTIANPTFTPLIEGEYKFILIVNDGEFPSDSSSPVTYTARIPPADNTKPTAIAGGDRGVNVGDLTTLQGSGEDTEQDNDKLGATWSNIIGPEGSTAILSNHNIFNPEFTPDKVGSYKTELTVYDGFVNSDPDEVIITASTPQENRKPSANAGPDVNVEVGEETTLLGTASDPDKDSITFEWVLIDKPGGSTASLSNPNTPTPKFTPAREGPYKFSLVTHDGELSSERSEVVITAIEDDSDNNRPVAYAGCERNVNVDEEVTLAGFGSDEDEDDLIYMWSLKSSPTDSGAFLSNPVTQSPKFTPDLVGDYTFVLIVNDEKENSETAEVTIKASTSEQNRAPSADAGQPKTIRVDRTVTLSGTGSDPDHDSLTYLWIVDEKPEDSETLLSDNDVPDPTFEPDKEGDYIYILTVNDGKLDSDECKVTYVAKTPSPDNHRPRADAGPDRFVEIGDEIELQGSGSDPDGDSITFRWSITGPEGSAATLSNPNIRNPKFTPDKAGSYILQLITNDRETDSTPDKANIAALITDACVHDGTCAINSACSDNSDCESRYCANNKCTEASCDDEEKNQGESDTDCGGNLCPKCGDDEKCHSNSDCATDFCSFGVCRDISTCNDGFLSGTESAIDCGGACPRKCQIGKNCDVDADCESGLSCSLQTCSETRPGGGALIEKDSDNDGIPDEWELEHGLDPFDPSDADLDFDEDGLTNAQEFTYGTEPYEADSDGDGVSDKKEIDKGSDPTNPEVKPKGILGTLIFIIVLIIILGSGGYGVYYYLNKSKEKIEPSFTPRYAPSKPVSKIPVKKEKPKEVLIKRRTQKKTKRERLFDTFGKKKEIKPKENKLISIGKEKITKPMGQEKKTKPTPKKAKDDVFSKLKLISQKGKKSK
jgi:hypothetical protein